MVCTCAPLSCPAPRPKGKPGCTACCAAALRPMPIAAVSAGLRRFSPNKQLDCTSLAACTSHDECNANGIANDRVPAEPALRLKAANLLAGSLSKLSCIQGYFTESTQNLQSNHSFFAAIRRQRLSSVAAICRKRRSANRHRRIAANGGARRWGGRQRRAAAAAVRCPALVLRGQRAQRPQLGNDLLKGGSLRGILCPAAPAARGAGWNSAGLIWHA